MASSIVRLVALDHDRMLRLVRRACTAGPSQQRWRDEHVQLVRAHSLAAAEPLAPSVLAQGGAGVVDGADQLRGVDERLAAATTALSDTAVDAPGMGSACDQLRRLLGMHADLLGEQVLGPLEHAVPRREIRRLGGVYEKRRDQVLEEQGADAPTPRRLDLPRAELYELARRAGIEGRSAMSRRDLISELQRRQSPR
jgi:hypothetical protein